MNSFAPSTEQKFSGSPHNRTAGADAARQPSDHSPRRLARGYIPALCAAVSIPLLTFAAAAFPLNATGVIAVTAWVSVEIVYIVHVLIDKQRTLDIGARKWDELRDNALALEEAYEKLGNKYNALYAEYLLQRGAVPLVAKRARGTTADSSGVVNGSAVVNFPTNPKGAA